MLTLTPVPVHSISTMTPLAELPCCNTFCSYMPGRPPPVLSPCLYRQLDRRCRSASTTSCLSSHVLVQCGPYLGKRIRMHDRACSPLATHHAAFSFLQRTFSCPRPARGLQLRPLSASAEPEPLQPRVYLVGSGIGGKGYLTVQAQELLQKADAVVYDALADEVS